MSKPTNGIRTGTATTPITGNDALERSRIKDKLLEVLQKVGGYEPVDDIYVDQIIESTISSKKVGRLLNSKTATEFTFSRVADAQVKYARIINDAFDRLCISRRGRLTGQDGPETIVEVRNAFAEALRIASSDQ